MTLENLDGHLFHIHAIQIAVVFNLFKLSYLLMWFPPLEHHLWCVCGSQIWHLLKPGVVEAHWSTVAGTGKFLCHWVCCHYLDHISETNKRIYISFAIISVALFLSELFIKPQIQCSFCSIFKIFIASQIWSMQPPLGMSD